MPSSLVSFVKQYRIECICFALFILLAVIGFSTHEASYDEAQAWQIARTAPLSEIIWGTIPIHEGHPPFWHLLLAGPAKLGVPFHWAVNVLGMIFLLTSGFLLFFKSPFPRYVRCCLPFNFFLFYQYGITVRPYGPMMVLLCLLAVYFPQKDKRPGLFVGLLAALCACHLFGIAIAGGITLAWLWEIKDGQPWKTYLANLRKDTRFQWMLGLLAFALLLLVCITVPRFGAALQPAALPLSISRHAVYVLAAMPAEAVLTNFDSSFQTTRRILPWAGLISTAVVGLSLWALTLLYTPRKKWLYLLLPYACLSAVMLGYSSCHHVGVILLLFIWYFWINCPLNTSRWPGYVNLLAKLVLITALVLPIGWNLNVLYWDYKLPIYPGKEMVGFLKKYNLTDQTIFVAWVSKKLPEDKTSFNTNATPAGVLLNMHLDHNIFANFHDGKNKTYVENFCPPLEQMFKVLDQWREKDVPTVLINRVPMDFLYNNPEVLDEYRVAFTTPEYQLWKLNPPKPNPQTIYLVRTLWDKYKDQILAEASPQQLPLETSQTTREKTGQ